MRLSRLVSVSLYHSFGSRNSPDHSTFGGMQGGLLTWTSVNFSRIPRSHWRLLFLQLLHFPKVALANPQLPTTPLAALLRFCQALLRVAQKIIRNGLDKQAVFCKSVESYKIKMLTLREGLDRGSFFCHPGQEKYVAERMVEVYVRSTGLPAAVMRVGQIAGPVHGGGVWPPREWFPTLLRASQHIGALPSKLGRHNDIDWIPVDILS
ncbi:hypothetical protein QBC46DRAFT_414566 [Diplogelasinospora grovesii]|uniref:Thioester reductase (TE) domain-containing protein n=1 Tax=Diplogelasinospora grovesii TaxID=303347 RepID=A0AAN6RYB2_9PEZI|nr:hypothetical protein QBC46DRAFT_414566 [Diplogelasinospora grovesii]